MSVVLIMAGQNWKFLLFIALHGTYINGIYCIEIVRPPLYYVYSQLVGSWGVAINYYIDWVNSLYSQDILLLLAIYMKHTCIVCKYIIHFLILVAGSIKHVLINYDTTFTCNVLYTIFDCRIIPIFLIMVPFLSVTISSDHNTISEANDCSCW